MVYNYSTDQFVLTLFHVFCSQVCLEPIVFDSTGSDDRGKTGNIK